MEEEIRQPHPKYHPLPAYKAPVDCKLWAHMDEAYFQENGHWIQYYKDGRYFTVEKVQEIRDAMSKVG